MAEFKTSGASDAALAQLLQLAQFSQNVEAQDRRNFSSKQQALVSQLNLANTSEKLSNIEGQINKFNKEVLAEGFDEYSLNSAFSEKRNAFNVADIAFKQAEQYYNENNFQAEGIGSTEDLYNQISSLNWEEMTQTNSDLYKIKNKIEIAEGYGYRYTSPQGVGGKSLKGAIDTRLGQIGARMHVWEENEGEFMVFDENGDMDAASREMYEEYMYDIMSGDVESFKAKYGKDIGLIQQKYKAEQTRYNSLNYLHQQAKAGNNSGEMLEIFSAYINQNVDENSSKEDIQMYNSLYSNIEDYISLNGSNAEVDEQWFLTQRANAMDKGSKYNKQHEVLTGDLWDSNPTWLGWDVAEETSRIALERQEKDKAKEDAKTKLEDKKEDDKIPSATDTFKIVDKEYDLPYTINIVDGKETKTPTLIDNKNKFTEEGSKYLFDKVWNRQNQEMDIGQTISNIAERQGISQDKVWEEYRKQMDVYAKEEGVAKGEFKEVKRGGEVIGYEFIPVKDRVEPTKRPKSPEETPEYKAELEMRFLEDEFITKGKNAAQAWSKSPSIYNESVKQNVNILLETDDITNIIDFGKKLNELNIDLKKKGAFPGAKEEIDRLKEKIKQLIDSESDATFRRAYIKEINKAFRWTGSLMYE
jgi:hypothetical protein